MEKDTEEIANVTNADGTKHFFKIEPIGDMSELERGDSRVIGVVSASKEIKNISKSDAIKDMSKSVTSDAMETDSVTDSKKLEDIFKAGGVKVKIEPEDGASREIDDISISKEIESMNNYGDIKGMSESEKNDSTGTDSVTNSKELEYIYIAGDVKIKSEPEEDAPRGINDVSISKRIVMRKNSEEIKGISESVDIGVVNVNADRKRPIKEESNDEGTPKMIKVKMEEDSKPTKVFNVECCKFCRQTFLSTPEYDEHLQDCLEIRAILKEQNEGKGIFECDLCDKPFKDRVKLNIHRLKCKYQTTYVCDLCKKTFVGRAKIDEHVLKCHTRSFYACDLCDRAFPCRALIDAHVLRCPKLTLFACDICGRSFGDQIRANDHVIKCHQRSKQIYPAQVESSQQELYDHKINNKETNKSSPQELNNHQSVDNSLVNVNVDRKRPIKEENNNEGTSKMIKVKMEEDSQPTNNKEIAKSSPQELNNQQTNLQQRLIIYTRPIYKCKVCNELYASQSLLDAHEKLHENQNNKKHTCKICHFEYHFSADLDSHILKHHKCSSCSKMFLNKECLMKHKRLKCPNRHHYVKRYPQNVGAPYEEDQEEEEESDGYLCGICEANFDKKNELVSHMTLHTVCDNKCDVCSKFFLDEDSLIKHMDSHEDALQESIQSNTD